MSRRRVMMLLLSLPAYVRSFIERVSLDGGTLDNEIGFDDVDENSSLTMLPNAYKGGTLYSILPEDGTGDFDVVRGSSATRVNAEGLIESVSNNEPRIDYTSGSPVLLLEPQATNLVPWSETLGNNAKSGAISFTDNSVISPYGDLSGSVVSVSSSNDRLQPSFAATGGDVAISIFLKHDGTDFNTQLNTFNTGTSNLFGAIATVTSTGVTFASYQGGFSDAGFVDYGNGWFRVFVVCQSTSGTTFVQWRPSLSSTAISYPCFGFQVEEPPVTSYIPTTGTIATRLADSVSGAGDATTFNSTEGVLYAEIAKRQEENDDFILISLNNAASNSADNSVTIGFNNDTKFYARVRANAVNVMINTAVAANENQFYKLALKYKSGNISFFIDGVNVVSNTTAFSFGAVLDNLSFDYDGNGTLPFYGKMKDLRVYNTALTDAELITLTS